MTGTIGERLARTAASGFVGRERELAALTSLTSLTAAATETDPPFLVAFVHGPGGIGKSTLLRRVVDGLGAGTKAVVLDGRDVEPTPRGFRQALGGALGLGAGDPGTAALARAIRGADRTLLVVDTYEVLGLLDGWLRTRFLPALPASVRTVLAGRDRPTTAWHTAAGWAGQVTEIRLEALAEPDALTLLAEHGLTGIAAREVNAVAHGHPLALQLGAAGARAGTGVPVLPELLDAFLGDLPEPVVTAVEAASTVRRVTEPVLRALLGDDAAREAWDALRALPFTDAAADGLLLHDVVRDTVGRELDVRDPETRRAHRRRAARFYATRPLAVGPNLWRHTADLMFLIENPVVRDACFPSARPDHAVEPARPGDGGAIAKIVAAHEPARCAAALDAWWGRHPETFAVARGTDGEVDAFVQIAERDMVDPTVLAVDPVTRPWTEHLRAAPPAPGEQVLFMRRWLGRKSGELRSPAVSACWLDVKRVYMELRPRLRRLYSTVVDLPALGPIFLPLGFVPVGAPVEVDGVVHQGGLLDFGPRSVDGWLGRLVEAETEPPPPGLSPRETEVLRLVAAGLTNREIGATLHISERTAARHVSTLLSKLGVRTRVEAARIAAERAGG